MALELSLSFLQTDHGHALLLTDLAGEYNAVANPTGWQTATSGGTNIQIDDESITEAYIRLRYYSDYSLGTFGADYVIDLTQLSTWIAVTPYTTATAPFDALTTPSTLSYTITESVAGGSFADGIWLCDYLVSDGSASASASFTFTLFSTIECFVWNHIARIPDNYLNDTCNNTYIMNSITLWGLYLAMVYAASQGNATRFAFVLETLTDASETLGYLASPPQTN